MSTAQKKPLPFCYQFSYNSRDGVMSLHIAHWLIAELATMLQGKNEYMKKFYQIYGGDSSLFAGFGLKGKSFGWKNSIALSDEGTTVAVYSFALNKDTYKDALLSLQPLIYFANNILKEFRWEHRPIGEEQKKIRRQQLIAIEWTAAEGELVSMLCATLNKNVHDFLAASSGNSWQKIVKAMRHAEKKTENIPSGIKLAAFRLYWENRGLLVFEVPGNACTLSTCGHGGLLQGWGKVLTPHNIWKQWQKLLFLAALAKLGDLYMKAPNKKKFKIQ